MILFKHSGEGYRVAPIGYSINVYTTKEYPFEIGLMALGILPSITVQ